MNAPASFPFARAAAALAAYERNARDVVRWAHRSWLAAALGRDDVLLDALDAALPDAGRAHVEACSRALLNMAGVAAPPLTAFIAAGVAMFDALPIELGLRALRMRALIFRGADVRRLIDKTSRIRIAQWAGVSLDRLVRDIAGPPDVARLTRLGKMCPLDEVDADTLAQEGYALVVRDQRDAHGLLAPCPLLRLALPREMDLPPWFDSSTRTLDTQGTRTLVAHLPEWIPEWGWLFG